MPVFKHKLLVVFIVAFLCRIGFFLFAFYHNGPLFSVSHSGDAYEYDQLALSLIQGRGFSIQSGGVTTPETFRTPVYPVFLSSVYWMFGHRPYVVILFQNVIGAFTCVIVLLLERLIFRNESRDVSGWMLAFYPLSIVFDNMLLTESLFTCLFAGGTFYFVKFLRETRYTHACLSGVLFGIASVCRPIAIYIVVLLIIFMFFMRLIRKWNPRWRTLVLSSVLMFVSYSLVVYPWMLRNRNVTGTHQVSRVNTSDAWMRPLAFIRSIQSGQSKYEELVKIWEEYEKLNSPDQRGQYRNRAFQEILNSNPAYWKLHLWGMANTLFSPQTAVSQAVLGVKNESHVNALYVFPAKGVDGFFKLLYQKKALYELVYICFFVAYSAVLYSLALYCFIRHLRDPLVIILCLMILYIVIPPGVIGTGRYRIPAMPLVTILSSCGLWEVLRSRRFCTD